MPRIASRRQPPIGFAHRGARAHAPENTIPAFELAVRLGATGLESDVWITSDGVPVLDHDGVVGRLRRTRLAAVACADLPEHIPTLAAFYAAVGPDLPVSLDVKDPASFDAVVTVAESAGAAENLWLCYPAWEQLAAWRERSDAVNLVDSTRLGRIKEGVERRAASLRSAGIDAINLHHSDWSAGMTTMFHRFDLDCFGWDAQLPRILDELLAKGIDGVFSDHVDRMMDALARLDPDPPGPPQR